MIKIFLVLLTMSWTLSFSLGVDAKATWSKEVLRRFQRLHPCPSTGSHTGRCPGWEKNHIIPLCNGGPDMVSNLQWIASDEAAIKRQWENAICNDKPELTKWPL
jgi:hypothetical protein